MEMVITDAAVVSAQNPDVVILASGADPLYPPIPGIDGPAVVDAQEVLYGRVPVPSGARVAVRYVRFASRARAWRSRWAILATAATRSAICARVNPSGKTSRGTLQVGFIGLALYLIGSRTSCLGNSSNRSTGISTFGLSGGWVFSLVARSPVHRGSI